MYSEDLQAMSKIGLGYVSYKVKGQAQNMYSEDLGYV